MMPTVPETTSPQTTDTPAGYRVSGIPALKDNYIWILHNDQQAYVVDPGEAKPVMDFLQQHALQPQAILITHRHADHVGGIPELLAHYALPVIGPAGIAHISHIVAEGDTYHLQAFDRTLQVLAIPGHTQEHIAFWCSEELTLFSGDTIFSAGCGRLLGGTAEQLFASLNKIARLPDATKIYAAHEYTQANLRFALSLEPDHAELLSALVTSQNTPTLPTSLGKERRINPFLRCDDVNLQQAALAQTATKITAPLELFVYLRHAKDGFQ
jgi:hydroxyacylglutathione hydrolase